MKHFLPEGTSIPILKREQEYSTLSSQFMSLAEICTSAANEFLTDHQKEIFKGNQKVNKKPPSLTISSVSKFLSITSERPTVRPNVLDETPTSCPYDYPQSNQTSLQLHYPVLSKKRKKTSPPTPPLHST
jgi:hypothetical protein